MDSHRKHLSVISKNGTPLPHITLKNIEEDYDYVLSIIYHSNNSSNYHSSEIHVTPEHKKKYDNNRDKEESISQDNACVKSQPISQ